jgi:hypothetical protein
MGGVDDLGLELRVIHVVGVGGRGLIVLEQHGEQRRMTDETAADCTSA